VLPACAAGQSPYDNNCCQGVECAFSCTLSRAGTYRVYAESFVDTVDPAGNPAEKKIACRPPVDSRYGKTEDGYLQTVNACGSSSSQYGWSGLIWNPDGGGSCSYGKTNEETYVNTCVSGSMQGYACRNVVDNRNKDNGAVNHLVADPAACP
jgi:hypothetical protein